MHNLRHLLTIVLSAFQEMSYFDQTRAGKLFQKMASRCELDVRCGGDRVRDQGFCCWSKLWLGHRSYLDYRRETGYNDGAKAVWPRPKRLRSVVFVSKQTALDGSAQLFESVPACQAENFATT